MNELGNSVIDVIKKRTTSIAFGTYVFFWATFHWQGIYTTLFVSEDKIYTKYHLLKNEYVSRYFFGYIGNTEHTHPLMIIDWKYILAFLIPLALTLIFVWPLPKFALIHLYRIEQEHKTQRLSTKYVEEKKRRAFEIASIEQEAKKVEATTTLTTTRKEAERVDPSIIWKEEYEQFKMDPAFSSFTNILESVYEHNGSIRITDQYDNTIFEIAGGALMIADTNDLVKIDNGNNKISLTDKGKYFAKNYPYYASR